MTRERTHLQRKALQPDSSAGRSSAGQQDGLLANSPAMLAQRKQLASVFGGAAQLVGPEEELQKKAPEEELQKKAAPGPELKAKMPEEELPGPGK